MNIKGIDISNWQQGINFSLVKKAGIEVVYIKATQGVNYVDGSFKNFYENAKASGFKIGFYHFLVPTINGADQARYMYSQIKNLDYQCKIAIDIEVSDGVRNSNINKCILDFANEIKLLTGDDPILYSYLSFANTILDKSVSHLEFWQAQYGVSSPTPANLFRSNLVGWQYSNEGHFPQTTDLDVFSDQIYRNSTRKKADDKTPITKPVPAKPAVPKPAVPKESKIFKIGDHVKVKEDALTYATGQEIPAWVKNDVYTVIEISDNKVLLEPINSWFYINDIINAKTQIKNFAVGESVKIKQNTLTYATGQEIPNWVKGNIYIISEVSSDRVLLEPINSWVLKVNLEII
ncbi:MAG: GH25 family lysozyme [Sarcina sp.]